jgi:hypothetical protein
MSTTGATQEWRALPNGLFDPVWDRVVAMIGREAKSRRRVETSATAFQKGGRDTQPVRQCRRIR